MPNRGQKCCKNYTYKGFVNKINNNKVVLIGEQIYIYIKKKKNHASCIIKHIVLSKL
jgi:hypothetical protein